MICKNKTFNSVICLKFILIFCRKSLIGFIAKYITVLRQISTLQFPFKYTQSLFPVLQNPTFPPKYGLCGTLGISSYS